MTKYSLRLRVSRLLIAAAFVLSFVLGTSLTLDAQGPDKPQVPKLSLTGSLTSYNNIWYPDGKIWIPAAKGGQPREFLMPVFIENQWYHYKQLPEKSQIYKPEPIRSFQFKIFFDSLAVTPIEIVKHHPLIDFDRDTNDFRYFSNTKYGFGGFYDPLAKDFNITWEEHQDSAYKVFLQQDPPPAASDRGRGRILKVTGTSEARLPNTDTSESEFLVLFYVKFRVNLDADFFDIKGARTPIYISPDTIRYNDLNVTKEAPFKNWRTIHNFVEDDYPDPTDQALVGLAGINYPEASEEKLRPGSIWLEITQTVPRFGYRIARAIGNPDGILQTGFAPELWIMADPMTVDSGGVTEYGGNVINVAQREFELYNTVSRSRMLDIEIESDSPWLQFSLRSDNSSKILPRNTRTTKGYIKYLDNDILGKLEDAEGRETEEDPPTFVTVFCDPSRIIDSPYPNGGEKAGVYVGYITFMSKTAEITPTRLRVTFINFRNPFEPPLYEENGLYSQVHGGIKLTIENASAQGVERAHLVFGTGHRATDGVDSLFGETYNRTSFSGFNARWYHPDPEFRLENNLQNGYGDFYPNDEQTETGIEDDNGNIIPLTGSRDIRNLNDTLESITYLCRFNAGSANNYPITVSWDLRDFPEDAVLFITDTANGQLFPSVNMREATALNQFTRAYTIQDPKITSFLIEYTLPRVIDYIDPDGEPIINPGWNLLSMPVRAKNTIWEVFYPRAINIPYFFSQNQYQTDSDGRLRVGVGYFIKYSQEVDTKFSGVIMRSITPEQNDDGYADRVRIFPGWNTIGTITFPIPISEIRFEPYLGETPSSIFVREHGVWEYVTNEGYKEVAVLEPGLGYWLKADRHGLLSLKLPGIDKPVASGNYDKYNNLDFASKVTVKDNGQNVGELYLVDNSNFNVTNYELPPLPPAGMFDARFSNGALVENQENTVLRLQAVNYPLSISINDAQNDYTFIDPVTGEVFGTINAGSNNNIEIEYSTSDAVKIVKTATAGSEYSVSVNPNPMVSESEIKLSLLEDGMVTVKVYDLVGNEVATLVNEFRSSGEYFETLDASALATGRYIVKMNVNGITKIANVTVVK